MNDQFDNGPKNDQPIAADTGLDISVGTGLENAKTGNVASAIVDSEAVRAAADVDIVGPTIERSLVNKATGIAMTTGVDVMGIFDGSQALEAAGNVQVNLRQDDTAATEMTRGSVTSFGTATAA